MQLRILFRKIALKSDEEQIVNIKSINGKEQELEDEFEEIGLAILGITETKKEG